MRRVIIVLGAALWLLAKPSVALAHDTGQGRDVGYAHVTAAVANGVATVDLQLSQASPADCRRLQPERLAAQRADQVVAGTFVGAGDCAYRGTIALPAAGKWVVTAAFVFQGQPTSIDLPVGVGGDVTTFQHDDWIHVATGSGRSLPVSVGSLALGAGGLLVVGLAAYGARSRRAPRRRRAAPSR